MRYLPNRANLNGLASVPSLILLASASLFGQINYQIPQRGTVPEGFYEVSKIETIDAASGNVGIHIPLAVMPPGRAGFSNALDLYYNSNSTSWLENDSFIPIIGEPVFTLVSSSFIDPADSGGWHYGFQYSFLADSPPLANNVCGDPSSTGEVRFRIVFPDGSSHTLYILGLRDNQAYYPTWLDINCVIQTGISGTHDLYTTDGTYAHVSWNADTGSWTLNLPDGRTIKGTGAGDGTNSSAGYGFDAAASDLFDRNGNHINIASTSSPDLSVTTVLTDDLGRTTTLQHAGDFSQDVITQNGYQGQPLTWTIAYTFNDLPSDAAHSYTCGVNTCYGIGGGAQIVISSITLPNGLSYQFCYDGAIEQSALCAGKSLSNSNQWGQLSDIFLPTGAWVHYGYTTVPDIGPLGQGPVFTAASKALQWTDQADGSTRVENSSYSFTNTSSVFTNPDGSQVTHYFYDIYSALGGAPEDEWFPGLVYQTVDAPSGNITEQFWARNAIFGSDAPGNGYVQTELKSVGSAGSPVLTSAVSHTVDRNGRDLSTAEYDWFSYGSVGHMSAGTANNAPPAAPTLPGTWRRTTSTSYAEAAGPASSSTGSDDPGAYWYSHTPFYLEATCETSTAGVDSSGSPSTGSHTEFLYDGNAPGSVNCASGQPLTNGNVTGQLSWDSTLGVDSHPLSTANSDVTSKTYDSFGNVLTSTNARGVTTNYTYDGNSLYVTQMVDAYKSVDGKDRTYLFSHDQSTGVTTSDTDSDHGINRNYGYDKFGRITSIQENGVRTTSITYDDANRVITATTDLNHNGDQALQQSTSYDQLGRERLTVDPAGNSVQTRHFNSSGDTFNYELVSNPYVTQQEPTMGWTRTKADSEGRTVEIAHFSGQAPPAPWGQNSSLTGVSNTSYVADGTNNLYCGNISDEAGVAQHACNDALGRLLAVTEQAISATTRYGYSALDDLETVTQSGVNNRNFVYSSLKRLTSATNPESGTVGYTYDSGGNLQTKTDGSNITTTYTYDSLNQLTGKSYNDGVTPSVSYQYDHSWATQVAAGAAAYNYTAWDGLGRVTQATQTIGSNSFTFTLASKPNVGIDWIQYPGSNRTITTGYDSAGRPITVNGQVAGNPQTNYLTAVTYQPHGTFQTRTFGNGIVETRTDNSRLQAANIQIGGLLALGYTYSPSQNNGNVLGQTITRGNETWNQSFGYAEPSGGSMNRLTSASESGQGSWSQNFCYDNQGNRWLLSSASLFSPTYDTPQGPDCNTSPFDANNHISGWNYDGAGDSTSSATGNAYQYDAEGHLISATINGVTTTYLYDGDGHRVQKSVGGSVTTYVYDPMGNLAQEYGAPTDTSTRFLHVDALGSTRLVTDLNGDVTRCYDYSPFGEELGNGLGGRGDACFGGSQYPTTPDVLSTKFTGKERDSESGLDFFQARYYGSALGRFTSPDPLSGHPADPQSWNAYVYALNNPLLYSDPNGLKYRVCQTGSVNQDTNCTDDVTDDEFQSLKDQSKGTQTFSGGKVYAVNADGTRGAQTGTYEQTDRDADSGAQQVFQGNRPLWRGTLIAGKAAGVGIVAVSAIPLAAVEAPSLLGPTTGRVFWSTARGAANAARFAYFNYGTTLNQTVVGSAITILGKLGVETEGLWGKASAAFAAGAQGPSMAFVEGTSATSYFMTKELPALLSNNVPIVLGK